MAATALSTRAVLLIAALAIPLRADRVSDVRAQITYVASALSAGNPADAMTRFDKSLPNYDTLRGYFDALGAFQVENEIDIVDEQDNDAETKLTVNWTLTLTDLASDSKRERSGEINVRLVQKDGKWKIVDFTPIELFNPQKQR